MEKSKQKEVGLRLKNLREEANLSQKELAEVLKNRDILKTALDGETGGHTISQIERAVRGLTIDMALEYTKIFNVSLDYIYGESNNLKPEYNEIIEKIGLSDKAIKNLEEINNNNKIAISVLNYLLSTKPELFNLFLTMLNKYAIFDKNKKPHKIIMEKLEHANNENLEDELLLLLFKVSEISKSLAHTLRKSENDKYIEEHFSNLNKRYLEKHFPSQNNENKKTELEEPSNSNKEKHTPKYPVGV